MTNSLWKTIQLHKLKCIPELLDINTWKLWWRNCLTQVYNTTWIMFLENTFSVCGFYYDKLSIMEMLITWLIIPLVIVLSFFRPIVLTRTQVSSIWTKPLVLMFRLFHIISLNYIVLYIVLFGSRFILIWRSSFSIIITLLVA